MAAKTTRRTARVGPGRLTAAQAELLPDRLLDAARDLFVEEGFAGATMEKIAKRAGASTKTLYSRFANKEDMLLAVVRRVVDRTVAAHADTLPIELLETDLRAFLIALCTQITSTIATETAGLNRLALAEGHRIPEFRRLHAEAIARGSGAIRAALEHWHARGRLPELVEPQRAAELCLGMATDFARIRTSLGDPPSKAEIDAHVAYAVDLFLRGCGYAGKPRGALRKAAAD